MLKVFLSRKRNAYCKRTHELSNFFVCLFVFRLSQRTAENGWLFCVHAEFAEVHGVVVDSSLVNFVYICKAYIN